MDGSPEEKAPELTVNESFRLTFNKNKNLALTDKIQIVSAH